MVNLLRSTGPCREAGHLARFVLGGGSRRVGAAAAGVGQRPLAPSAAREGFTRGFKLTGAPIPRPLSQGPKRLDRFAREAGEGEPFLELGIKEVADKVGGIRVRQHVNPLKRELQQKAVAPVWNEVYDDPDKALHVDLGCGPGRFLLLKARREPEKNFLGLDIRTKLTNRANSWAEEVGVHGNTHFMMANATINVTNIVADYAGSVQTVSIQFPDPHFKKRHHKRRIVQPALVADIAAVLAPGAQVFLQSDVLEVAEAMRDQFEEFGAEHFRPCEAAHGPKGALPLAVSSKSDDDDAVEAADDDSFEGEWAAWGWLPENPMNVPTEREVYVLNDGLPVYRVLLDRV